MAFRIHWTPQALVVAALVGAAALVQSPRENGQTPSARQRRRSTGRINVPVSSRGDQSGEAEDHDLERVAPEDGTAPPRQAPRRIPARTVAQGGSLPSGDGQMWREYDIRPYTTRVTATSRPEQAIVDWILRETGYEVWHTGPLGFMNANADTLTVYHTPQMQEVVAEVVDRFTDPEAQGDSFGLRVITIENPNWRARAQRMMQPVPVETQGVQAWLLENEDAALLLAELRKRTDYREHNSSNLVVANGESTVVAATRTRGYVRDITLTAAGWPGFEPLLGQIDEGFSLELSPLASLDGSTVDVILKCNIDQVERLRPVVLDVPTPVAPRQRTKIEVPQVSHCRLHERFRWPAGQVLLVGLGVVATPVPTDPNPLRAAIPVPTSPPRADLLVLVECKGKSSDVPAASRTVGGDAKNYHGRY